MLPLDMIGRRCISGFKLLMMSAYVALMAMSVTSCGSSRHVASSKGRSSVRYESSASGNKSDKSHSGKPDKTSPRHIDMSVAEGNPATAMLLSEADEWIGTPYLWAGNDRNGVDCSGFVLQVYLRALEISLPRNSEKQMQYCSPVDKKDLIPGDLVFFTVRGGKRVGHVGIYIGGNNMVHASSSKGVIITSLDNPYFVTNYYSAGRVERYFAMLGDKSKIDRRLASKTAKPSERKTGVKPAAQQERKEPQMTAQKPKTERQPLKGDVAKRKEKDKKENRKSASKPSDTAAKKTIATPMPSDVFASTPAKPEHEKRSVEPVDEAEESSEFFD